MKSLKYLIIITIYFLSESICVAQMDSFILDFRTALDAEPKAHEQVLKDWEKKLQVLNPTCHDSVLFFKKYAGFCTMNYYDQAFLDTQKDILLPCQISCVGSDDPAIIITNFNIARGYDYLLDFDAAEDYYLKVANQQTNHDSIIDNFSRHYYFIGRFFRNGMDFEKASIFFEKAIQTYRGDKSDPKYLRLLHGKGLTFKDKGDYNNAIIQLKEAIELSPQIKNLRPLTLSLIYEDLALCYREVKDFKNAKINSEACLKVINSTGNKYVADQLRQSTRHANILKSNGDYDASLALLGQIKELYKVHPDKISLSNVSGIQEDIADVYHLQGEHEKAIQGYQSALNVLHAKKLKSHLDNHPIDDKQILDLLSFKRQMGLKAQSLFALAEQSNSDAIYKNTLDAVLKFDTLSQMLLTSNWDEASHLKAINESSSVYETGVLAATKLHANSKSKQDIEQALEISSKFKAQLLKRGIQQKKDDQISLSDSLKKVSKGLRDALTQSEKEYAKSILDQNQDETAKAFSKYFNNQVKYDQFRNELKTDRKDEKGTDYYPFTIESVINKLDDDQAIIEYFIHSGQLHSFFVSKDQIVHDVNPYSTTELANYKAWLLDNNVKVNELDFSKKILSSLAKADTKNIRKLIIIPDNALLEIPFEALRLESDKYLIEAFDISYAYSIYLMEDFDLNEKVKFLGIASSYNASPNNKESGTLKALPFAVEEVKAIKEMIPGKIFLDHEATITNFENKVEDFEILHLALHSQLNSDYPDQSALIFESKDSVDFLTASEIYNLDLDAQLTVLSACNTNVGQLFNGDGVRSIARSFIHAGSQSVLTSLWDTPDVSTNMLMKNFYTNLQNGESKDGALRKAKLSYLENIQPSFKHPKYWAHLVLIGNTTPVAFAKGGINLAGLFISLGVVFFLFFFVIKKK